MGEQTTPIPQRIAPAISNIYLSSAGTQQSAPLYLLITEVSEQHLTLLSQNLNETLSSSSNSFGQEIQKSLTKHKIQKNEKSTSHIAPYDIPKIHKTTSRNEMNRESEPSIVKEPDKKIENYVHIPDRVVPPRAVAVLPKTLDIHRDCIYPQRAQPPRIRFGPVQGVIEKMLHADADKLVVEAAVKEKPLFLFKRDEESVTHINVDDKDRSNWLSLLPLGKTSTANVWLYEEDSKLYGITTKLIPARTPLALGYSKTYADEHKIPPGQPVLDLEEALAERPSGWCHECKRSLGSATLLLRHMKFYHKGKRNSHKKYRCSYCSRTFRRSSPISEEHEKIEEPEPSGSQSIEETKSPSDESFQNYTNALDFSTNLFDPDRISNIDMSESPKSEDELNTYPTGLKLDNLDNIEDYSKFCKGLKFENSDEQKAKIEELNIACPQCEQRLTKSKKRRHIRERLKCECGKIFRRNVDFAKHVHMRHNTGLSNAQIKHDPDQKTSYTCENCNVRFKRRGMLVNHLWRVHNTTSAAVPLERRVRHYPCSVCPKIYRTAAKRDRHVIIHHPGSCVRAAPIEGQRLLSEPARCSACPREYATRSKLLQHIRAQHPEIVVSTKSDSKSRPLVTITTLE